MAVLSQEIRNMPPDMRIKALKEIEEQKKKELKKKQKEIEDLEKQKKKEADEEKQSLKETEEMIKETIEDLVEEQERAFKELEAMQKRKPTEEISSLEETVSSEAKPTKQKQYTYFLENIRQEANFYEITNYNLINEVKHLRNKAHYEGLNREETQLIKNLKYQLEKVEENEMYKSKDEESDYLDTLSSAIRSIEHFQSEQTKDLEKRKKDTMYVR